MTNATLCFIDCETTGLDPDRHEIWEVGMIHRNEAGHDLEYVWQLPVDLAAADPIALNIGRFHDRRWPQGNHGGGLKGVREEGISLAVSPDDMEEWADRFVSLTRGAHLVGNVVSFDAERLWKLLRKHGQCPMWHYHLIDVEAMTAGLMGFGPPWSSDELSQAVGVEKPSGDELHTALGDARWARDLYDAVLHRAASTQALAVGNGSGAELAEAVELLRGRLPADESDNGPVAVPADALRTLIREGRTADA